MPEPAIDLSKPFCLVCGKQSYPTEEAARSAVGQYAKSGHNRRRALPASAYACPSGGGWHLRKPKRQRRT